MTTNNTIRGVPSAAQAHSVRAKAGVVLVDPHDGRAVRNIDNVLTLYQMMINENKAVEGTAKFLTPGYVQHNPLIADGSAALGKYFAGVKATHPSAHVVVHRIIAAGDYVFAHVNFINLLTILLCMLPGRMSRPMPGGPERICLPRRNGNTRRAAVWKARSIAGVMNSRRKEE